MRTIPTYLLFDADGTLLDYNQAEYQALKATLAWAGFKGKFEPALLFYREINIKLWKSFEKGEISQEILRTRRFALLRDELNLGSVQKVLTEEVLSKIYLKNLAKTGHTIEYALEVIKELHQNKKFTMAIVTNGLKDVQYDRLKAAGIHDYFKKIIISEEIGIQKPNKDFFEKSFKLLGSDDKESYMIIGDTYSSDIQGGINAGIKTCWFNPGKTPLNGNPVPDLEIFDLRELLPLLAH
ncbi:MAG: YjjG family noncanonical pyrimidine nucleotidase [Spirochaetales bacterium]|nr:YjjG family noncanonical pyrimidine nucleotidase [Spirochaetales bacterium]